jgi:hypothetical protein
MRTPSQEMHDDNDYDGSEEYLRRDGLNPPFNVGANERRLKQTDVPAVKKKITKQKYYQNKTMVWRNT